MTESAEQTIPPEAGETGTRLAAAGGVVAALATMSCCILPLALFSLGVSGVWVGKLSALTSYQPLFVGIGLVSLGFGYWRVYGKPTACAGGAACAAPRRRRLVKGTLWLASAMIVLALVWPYVLPAVLS